VEFVDIYPSIVQLCGLPVSDHCEGTSFVPLMRDPNQQWKEAIFSRWINGETVRTEQYNYTEWRRSDDAEVHARMLYDLKNDPDENTNIAELPENAELVNRLSEMLKKGWKPVRSNLKR
jgi:arylsulfatase A-like enzyme